MGGSQGQRQGYSLIPEGGCSCALQGCHHCLTGTLEILFISYLNLCKCATLGQQHYSGVSWSPFLVVDFHLDASIVSPEIELSKRLFIFWPLP